MQYCIPLLPKRMSVQHLNLFEKQNGTHVQSVVYQYYQYY